MGVFELHLHEPNFTLNVGDGGSAAESSLDWGRTDDESRPSVAGKLGPLLVVLAVVALAMRRNRRRG
ncbi:hypothetical protein [Haladaptatus salinisoli]|uniref:hypothetical protein n=1 Tax=Haladaptatus salinisoli TaxID=2884876 RepID=UPI001D0B71E1|nr:hypothetical protein [Haladaptatus salinisoli]